jgi:hypothetical protein
MKKKASFLHNWVSPLNDRGAHIQGFVGAILTSSSPMTT